MIDLLLNMITTGPPNIPIGTQTSGSIPNNILPGTSFGFAYTTGEKYGYVVGGRLVDGSTQSRAIYRVDLSTNEITLHSTIPTEIGTVQAVTSTKVGDIIYNYIGVNFFTYNVVTKEYITAPTFTDTRFVSNAGQSEGSYNGKIYKPVRVALNSWNVIEYDTLTNTHSIFVSSAGITNIGNFSAAIVVGSKLYIADQQAQSNVIQVDLITKAVTLIPFSIPMNGTQLVLAVGGGRLFVFNTNRTVSSIALTSPYASRTEPSITVARNGTAIFTFAGYAKTYIGAGTLLTEYSSYRVGIL